MPLSSAKLIETPEGHFYETPIGVLPSVTTILKATQSEKERTGLDWWGRLVTSIARYMVCGSRPSDDLIHEPGDDERGKVIWADRFVDAVARYREDGVRPDEGSSLRAQFDRIESLVEHGVQPDRIPDEVRDGGGFRGRMLHDAMEAWLIDSAAPAANDPVRPWWDSLQTIRTDLAPFLPAYAIEVPVWHPELRYAGTIDLGAFIRGFHAVIDWKTKDKPTRREYIRDYELQLAAYVVASQRCLRLPGGVILDSALCAVAVPERQAQEFPMEPADIVDAFEEFEERCERFHAEQGAA